MKTGIKDKNGNEIKIGDIIVFPYVNPMGVIEEKEDFKTEVLFKYGCVGFESETRFIPLMDWMDTTEGEYIANEGNKTVYTEVYPFWKLTPINNN